MPKRLKEIIDMYDMIIASLIEGKSIVVPSTKLTGNQVEIGFSNISSAKMVKKYYVINGIPDWVEPRIMDSIRDNCMSNGVKIDFYFYCSPHSINWDSPEMKNRMRVWKEYSNEHDGKIDVFDYRAQAKEAQLRTRMINSTRYLNEAEYKYKRTMMMVCILIEISAQRNDENVLNMAESINKLKKLCNNNDIKINELRVNMMDWIRATSVFSLANIKGVTDKLPRRLLTDDLLANFNSYKQGKIGDNGVCLGIDVLSQSPVMRKFKEDPDGPDNWLVAAATGGGKSYWTKTLLTYLLADGFTCCVMDYEGDEYLNLARYIKAGNSDDVKIVSMGNNSTVYFDPCEIPELTNDSDVDNELKKSATQFIMAIYRLIVHGENKRFTVEEERVMSLAISRMYDYAGVTDDKSTWHRSKGLRLKDVYFEIKEIVESKELMDNDQSLKHRAAQFILDSVTVYFEPGEAKYGMFENAMSANELYRAKLIIFSFGMKGAAASTVDPVIIGLKQLSVAYVNIQISNYCKYVKHGFNVKVWEEFQRWGDIEGSADIIGNGITGGRKRGDVNIILTNDLGAILDDDNKLCKKLRQNIQNYAIGLIPDASVRAEFCRKFDQQNIKIAIDNIAKAQSRRQSGSSTSRSIYDKAFCLSMSDRTKAIVQVRLPNEIARSEIFRTGVSEVE